MRSGSRQRGFTYLAALLAVGTLGLGLAAIGETWSHARQREKEVELMWIGEQFRQAIGLYYHRAPGGVRRYPATLEDLLEDRRFPNPQRYLRKIYSDPMTGNAEWGLIRAPEGGLIGVHSLSAVRPIRQSPDATTYAGWRFEYEPTRVQPSGNTP